MPDEGNRVNDLAFDRKGPRIFTAGNDGSILMWDSASYDYKVKVWDISSDDISDTPLRTLEHSGRVFSVAFDTDGKWIATGSEDNTAKLWDLATGKEILTLPGSSGGVYGVAFQPGEGAAHLVVAGNDGLVRVILLKIDELLAVAKSRVTRSLTPAECQKYLHSETCPGAP